MELLELKEVFPTAYNVICKSNQTVLGSMYLDVNSVYVFHKLLHGTWTGEVLVELCNKLIALNTEYKAELDKVSASY